MVGQPDSESAVFSRCCLGSGPLSTWQVGTSEPEMVSEPNQPKIRLQTVNSEIPVEPSQTVIARRRGAWRWHFYSAIFVFPVLFVLAATGAVILLKPTIERIVYGDMLYVQPVAQEPKPFADQEAAVLLLYDDVMVETVVPPRDSGRATQFDVVDFEGRSLSVYVNPFDGTVLGHIDNATRIDYVATQIHGTLWLGTWGDYLVEIVAGWALVLTATGVYLWLPRRWIAGSRRRAIVPRFRERGRKPWRDLHGLNGALISVVLIFLLLTGLPWSGFWGARMWTPFIDSLQSGYNFPVDEPRSGEPHHAADVATQGLVITWANQRGALPRSEHDYGAEPLTLEVIAQRAKQEGMLPGFAVGLPVDETGVFTVANAWPSKGQDERTLYLDQYSGQVLLESGWTASYGALAKATVWGVNTHMGRQLGTANGVVLFVLCIGVMFSVVSAFIMYAKRIGRRSSGFPRRPDDARLSRGVAVIAAVTGVLFPLFGATLLLVLFVDRYMIRVTPKVREMFGMTPLDSVP